MSFRTKNYIIGENRLSHFKSAIPWIKTKKLHSFWTKKINRLAYYVWLLKKKKINNLDDFHKKFYLRNNNLRQEQSILDVAYLIFNKKNKIKI